MRGAQADLKAQGGHTRTTLRALKLQSLNLKMKEDALFARHRGDLYNTSNPERTSLSESKITHVQI